MCWAVKHFHLIIVKHFLHVVPFRLKISNKWNRFIQFNISIDFVDEVASGRIAQNHATICMQCIHACGNWKICKLNEWIRLQRRKRKQQKKKVSHSKRRHCGACIFTNQIDFCFVCICLQLDRNDKRIAKFETFLAKRCVIVFIGPAFSPIWLQSRFLTDCKKRLIIKLLDWFCCAVLWAKFKVKFETKIHFSSNAP